MSAVSISGTVAVMYRCGFLCYVESRELSGKAETLVLIWMKWPVDTEHFDGSL